jgi:hypothetical protein
MFRDSGNLREVARALLRVAAVSVELLMASVVHCGGLFWNFILQFLAIEACSTATI